MDRNQSHIAQIVTIDNRASSCAADLILANGLMIQALTLLDAHRHLAAAYLDQAIVKLEIRPDGEGMPPEGMFMGDDIANTAYPGLA